MPTRSVYMLRIKGKFDNFPHPHVDLSGSGNDRLVVPCFTVGGAEVELYILDQKSLEGFAEAQIFVQLDNAKAVHWKVGMRSTISYWLPGRARRISKSDLGIAVGEMTEEAVALIVKSILARATKSKCLAPATRIMLEQMLIPPSSTQPLSPAPGGITTRRALFFAK